MDKEDDVIVVVDSIGNLASKKELDDAMNENSAADMSRAKAFKGLFRMVTPYLAMKNIPLIAINHTYKEIGLFPKDVVGGGTGIYYSANTIWIIGRRQNKTGTEVTGYDFVIKVEKSRYVKEQSKIPISVSWEGGIDEMSGLLDVAMASGHVVKPSNGWYQKVNEDKKYRLADLDKNFWSSILEDKVFQEFVKKAFTVGAETVDLGIELEE
jgi:hypothetical protein